MRNLAKNKQTISYLNFIRTEKVKDDNNHYTSEKIVIYTKAKQIKAHVSGAKGSSMVEVFGTDISYDKTILLTKSEFKATKITENSVFFIDTPVAYADENHYVPLYDYRVRRIAVTINEVLIAIEKVSANENNF